MGFGPPRLDSFASLGQLLFNLLLPSSKAIAGIHTLGNPRDLIFPLPGQSFELRQAVGLDQTYTGFTIHSFEVNRVASLRK